MAFSFVTAEQITPLIKGVVDGWRLELLNATSANLSARLAAWYPGLREAYDSSEPDSDLRNLVDAMVIDGTRRVVNNPDGMSSETMGPFAYSRFDSEDTAKNLFNPRDLKALGDILTAETRRQRGSFQMKARMFPAAPMPRPGKYTNSRRWKRY